MTKDTGATPNVNTANTVRGKFGFTRKSGVLMAVSSLPSPYGIGCFGEPCKKWIDFLVQAGQTCWQVLPLNPTAYGDSPYQSPASFAGSPYYIDLEELRADGLLTKKELDSARRKPGRVDYGDLFFTRITLLKKAFGRFKGCEEFSRFCKKNRAWLTPYALFMALKERFGYAPWQTWETEYKNYRLAAKKEKELTAETEFWKWTQFVFYAGWEKVRAYAKEKGIRIVGDMPIYVAADSADVWANPEQFLLDENFAMTAVAGVPPDAFSSDGQLWGNPLYDWNTMEKDGFRWWIGRIRHGLKLFDMLRIDHFRGFAAYYAVKNGEKTAKNGHWEPGKGKELFSAVKAALKRAKILAEDLGVITEDVKDLLAFTGYPGMKVLQFAFESENSDYLPKNYETENCVVYTGSHDSECTATWCQNLTGEARRRFTRYCPPLKGETETTTLIRLALLSKANLAVIPLQDWLELSSEQGRMNTPGTADGNWTWRVSPRLLTGALAEKMKKLCREYGRAAKTKTGKPRT